jgi:hypothetical protein
MAAQGSVAAKCTAFKFKDTTRSETEVSQAQGQCIEKALTRRSAAIMGGGRNESPAYVSAAKTGQLMKWLFHRLGFFPQAPTKVQFSTLEKL